LQNTAVHNGTISISNIKPYKFTERFKKGQTTVVVDNINSAFQSTVEQIEQHIWDINNDETASEKASVMEGSGTITA
jgi:hypothetical protein